MGTGDVQRPAVKGAVTYYMNTKTGQVLCLPRL
jgi:hypothetical protein